LVAGDAVVTTRQESTINVLLQRPAVWRPPAYYTSDWIAARRSVELLASLEPEVLATGHGQGMRGPVMRTGLKSPAGRFDRVMPQSGRYVPYPAVADERGLLYVPPPPATAMTRAKVALGGAAVAAAVACMMLANRRRSSRLSLSVE